MSPKLSQCPWIVGRLFMLVAVILLYISRNVKAASTPKPSALPEYASLIGPGTVPLPVHSSWSVVAIIQEKAPCFWELREVSLTIITGLEPMLR